MRKAALVLLALALVFAGLGVWQVRRLAWKNRLIAQTELAVHAAPIDAAALPTGDLTPLTYHRVAMTGHFVAKGTTLVTGTSVLGTGYWDLVPLVGDRGSPIMINLGFLPQGSKIDVARRAVPAGLVHIEGLLRPTEPGGTLLRANHPAQDRWYSRDIAAIAARRGVPTDPRLFIDSWVQTPASGTPGPDRPVRGGQPASGDQPVNGLTIIGFPNNHLAYALTWFTLGLMALGGAVVVTRGS
jgi:surfeit locus 1 family protein